MKVLDMFGSGLPVMAIDFPALPELVKHQENGIIFKTSEELSESMIQVLYVDRSSLMKLREGNVGMNSWDYTWTNLMEPIVLEICYGYRKRFRKSITCIFLFAVAALKIIAYYLVNKK
jgi:beta-1,4-mannosyltransferase